MTKIGSRPEESEIAKVGQAPSPSHKARTEPTEIMRRTKSDLAPSSTADKMTNYNMFPKGSNGIRKEPKGVRMAKEPQRIFDGLGFCKVTIQSISVVSD